MVRIYRCPGKQDRLSWQTLHWKWQCDLECDTYRTDCVLKINTDAIDFFETNGGSDKN